MQQATSVANGNEQRVSTELRRERMQRQARSSKAEATWRAYRSDWKMWEAWARANEQVAMPAQPASIAVFLSDMSTTRKPATLRRYLASLSACHAMRGHALDIKHTAIKTIMRGIAREHTGGVRRVKPLVATTVKSLMSNLGTSAADLRDAAVIALGVASGLRRSELSGLDWLERGEGTGVLRLNENGGAEIVLYRSKTSQAEPVSVHLEAGIALVAVRRWVEAAGLKMSTPLFRRVNKSGTVSSDRLGCKSVAAIVKRRAEQVGLDPQAFSGHSLRAGMVTSAALAGVPTWRIKRTSRHRSNIVEQYIRPVEDAALAITGEIGL